MVDQGAKWKKELRPGCTLPVEEHMLATMNGYTFSEDPETRTLELEKFVACTSAMETKSARVLHASLLQDLKSVVAKNADSRTLDVAEKFVFERLASDQLARNVRESTYVIR